MSTHRPAPAAAAEDGRRYDPGERLTAARISHASPHWHIHWGVSSRRYWAFPLFSAPPGTIVSDSDPAGLTAQMREAEAGAAALVSRR